MDYSLAALKLLCSQLRSARQTTTQNAYTIDGILFQRAWLQGIIISTPTSNNESGGARYVVDDGTGVFELLLSPDSRTRYRWETGVLSPLGLAPFALFHIHISRSRTT